MKNLITLTIVVIFALQGSAQILIRTNTMGEFSSTKKSNLEESLYYRFVKARSGYNIQSVYKRDSLLGTCLYGREINMMRENFEKKTGNSFRYWNKLRMGFKLLLEENAYTQATDPFWYYLDGEMYISYLHLPKSARGDHQARNRKGSLEVYFLMTANQRILTYVKYNFGSIWLKGFYRQEKRIPWIGIYGEWETNKKGYSRSLVDSSRDIYHGLLLFGGPEYDINLQKISLNIGVKITTENHG